MRVGRNILATLLFTVAPKDSPEKNRFSQSYLDTSIIHTELVEAPYTPGPYARGCYVTVRASTGEQLVLFTAKQDVVRDCARMPGMPLPVRREMFAQDTVDITIPYKR